MSIVVSAPIRTGKTLYCMQVIDKISKKEPHRRIYTNIIGCTYPGVIAISSTQEKPFDWRDLPNGAVLIYDECHEHPAFSKDDLLKTYEIDDSEYIRAVAEININPDLKVKEKEELVRQEKKKQEMRLEKAKEDIRDIGRSLTLHGHFGIDIYFITQKPYLLNASVRASCNEHIILRRLFKLKAATIYQFAELQEQFGLSTMKNALTWRFWKYPKQLYKFYISAEEHESSKQIPFQLVFWLCLPLLIFGFAFKNSLNSPFFKSIFGGEAKQEQTVQQMSIADQQKQLDAKIKAAEEEKNKPVDCNDLMNSHLEECVKYNAERQNRLNQQVQAATAYPVSYNPNDPYSASGNSQYIASAQPVFSGCIKFKGKYYAFSQQGTRLHVPASDCKRLIEDGDRPFNYFAKQQQQNQPMQQAPQQPPQSVQQFDSDFAARHREAELIAKYEAAKQQGLI
ncbi:zonular occludens toxin domain-containing protein [Acinetobacter nosocomialis]|uniref:zonular occludens toxin domain-containing protein n=1 Tax=Acinetobacter nosocomialis TaxID=106654 RepID=UPI001FF5DC28|nr:zonular occludens toxin domain-containing protein [Acinetobacter nosocomialis]MCJ9032788.1 zonular occludens toxin domain-containing protein [Acinetobacter nosocomialis]